LRLESGSDRILSENLPECVYAVITVWRVNNIMLAKEICLKCHNERNRNSIWLRERVFAFLKEWGEGTCFCPVRKYDENNDPPEDCPYVLEHMVQQC